MFARFETEFTALWFLDGCSRLRCVVRRWIDEIYEGEYHLVNNRERICEGFANMTQLHLLEIVISQCLVASEPLTLVDEYKSTQCCDHYWAARARQIQNANIG